MRPSARSSSLSTPARIRTRANGWPDIPIFNTSCPFWRLATTLASDNSINETLERGRESTPTLTSRINARTVEAEKAREQTLAAKEITTLAENPRIQRDGLRSALATSNQRLAALQFERSRAGEALAPAGGGVQGDGDGFGSAIAFGPARNWPR